MFGIHFVTGITERSWVVFRHDEGLAAESHLLFPFAPPTSDTNRANDTRPGVSQRTRLVVEMHSVPRTGHGGDDRGLDHPLEVWARGYGIYRGDEGTARHRHADLF